MRHLLLLTFFVFSFQLLHAQNDSLVVKKFTYSLPKEWGLQDRIEDGWADKEEPEAPYLVVDYVLYDINTQTAMDKYIDTWVETMKGDNHDAAKKGAENRSINGAAYTIVTVTYTKDGVKWQDLQYYTPKECGQICHGYAFSIRGPVTSFDKMKTTITAFEKSLHINN